MTGEELKELRTRLALTQAALAKEVGVTANTLARWERGKSSIPEAADKLIRDLADQQTTASAVSWAQSVVRDPHHQAIIDALNRRLDPDVFEACAADLLKSEWPTLVPVVGGSDDGYDGSVAKMGRDPFPLITTTSSRVKDNLERNLKRAISGGWSIKNAIFATSRRITPPTRKKLFAVAGELGVQLQQVYDQDWFANALYREPAWCKKLLGLTGRPSALSVYPVTRRPILGDKVYGREKEIQRLRDIDHDCVVVGGPGSGKTFLLRALALEGRALFLVDQDREAIANAIREQDPPAVIVDDAQLDDQQLTSLAQLRSEIGAVFRIIAVSWPAEAASVASALNLASSDFIKLELIDADTMVEVIKSAGIYRPDSLISSMVSQAEGRPGLAVTLAYLCLRGDVHDVVSGEALANRFGQIIDPDSSRLLGVFGLGGKAGVSPDVVSSYLGMPRYQVNSTLARLAAAGVVRESHGDSISVWPAALRWVLVRNTFFGGPESVGDFRVLFHQLPNKEEAVETLIGARARGATIPDLEELLENQRSPDLWSEYASLGPRESEFVLRRHPEFAVQVAASTLYNAPELILPLLFYQAQGDGRPLHNSLDQPLRKIQDWATGVSPDDANVVYLRKTLVQAADTWWRKSHVSDIAIRAMCIALNPGFETTTTDPGRGRTITFTSGLLRDNELEEIGSLWPSVLRVIHASEIIPWGDLFDVLHKWLHPDIRIEPTEFAREIMQRIAHGIMRDLTDSSREHPGLQHHLADIAKRADLKLEMTLNSDFEILYPEEDYSAEDDKLEDWVAAAEKLGTRWADEEFEEIASRIAWIETEANIAGLNYPRVTNILCAKLAQKVSEPVTAAHHLIERQVSPDLVEPFMAAGIRNKSNGWEELIYSCLESNLYRGVTVATLLVVPDLSEEVLDVAIQHAENLLQLIETCCLRGEVPDKTLEKLLNSNLNNVALAAAVGHWNAVRRNKTSDQFQALWRKVIAQSGIDGHSNTHIDYWIGEILSKDGKLAHDWLVFQMKQENKYLSYRVGEIAEKAIPALSTKQRIDVLHQIRSGLASEKVVSRLIGDELEIYQALLSLEELSRYHRAPLEGLSGQDWPEKAILALDAGYSPEEIARATLPHRWSWSGNESEMWNQWTSKFERLLDHPDPRIICVGQLGAERARARRDRAIEEERAEDVYGL